MPAVFAPPCRRLILAALLCLALGLWLPPAAGAAQEEIQGQTTINMVEGWFRDQPGSYATYWINDLQKKQKSQLYFAVLENTEHEGRPALWMELVVKPEDGDPVVTRILCERTDQGPGKPHEVIVQPAGYEPFTVPDSFLEEADGQTEGQVSQMQSLKPGKVEKSGWANYKGQRIKATRITGQDEKGQPYSVVVSESVPPLGLVQMKKADMTMTLDEWGGGAQSLIQGEPMNFYLWIAYQIGKGLGGETK